MIRTTFDVNFHGTKDEIPPKARGPQTKIKKKHKYMRQRVPGPVECPGGGSPPARKIIGNPVIQIPDNPCGLPLIIPDTVLYCMGG